MRLLAAMLLGLAAASAGAVSDVTQHFSAYDASSTATIDHSAWTAFLQEYVVVNGPADVNLVRYADVSQADLQSLRNYIEYLESIEISQYSRPVQRAFWLNLYNAAVVNLVLKHYPVQSILDIGDGFFGVGGPWDMPVVTVDGVALSLNEIEDAILRPIWNDAMGHYGLNCASMSCPNLLTQAYTAENIDRLLRKNAEAYVNSPRGVRFDDAGNLIVSSIYNWYMQDFGGSEASVIAHLRRFAKPELSRRLKAVDGIDDYTYDWSLNDAAEEPGQALDL